MSKKLDINKLKEKLGEPVSSEEALKEVIPLEWNKDVLEGKRKLLFVK